MPLYEYECQECGHKFEVHTTSFDVEPPPCPKTSSEDLDPCGGTTRKLISRTSFVLKGGGWFKDDYPS